MNTHGVFSRYPCGGMAAALVRWSALASCRDAVLGDLFEEADGFIAPRYGRVCTGAWLLLQAIASAPHLISMRWERRRVVAQPTTMAPAFVVSHAEASHAFSAFLATGSTRRQLRRLPLALSLVVHVALLIIGVGHSVWHLEELEPPRISVTLMAPPLVPPMVAEPKPPTMNAHNGPRAGGHRAPPVTPAHAHVDERPAIAAPTTGAPASALGDPDNSSGDPAPSSPGLGLGDGSNNVGNAGEMPHALAPTVADKQCLSCTPPELPPAFAASGMAAHVLVRLCVSAEGAVKDARVLQGLSALVDQSVLATVRGWRFRPYTVNDRPVPFCFSERFVFAPAH